jgi:opacity protein-like surface antigen
VTLLVTHNVRFRRRSLLSALLYGGGVDWKLFSHISARAGYRGLLFIAPDFNQAGQFTNARTQMKEPYAGVVIRF